MRYPDLFRNTLMGSHQISCRGELWYDNAFVAGFAVVSGSVSADRSGAVRRTAQINLDPNLRKIPEVKEVLNPYGAMVKLWRGVRYPNGLTEEVQVFYGRIDQVEESLQELSITCSDRAADIIDARFESEAWAGNYGTVPGLTCAECARQLILEVLPTATVLIETTNTLAVRPDTNWEQERGDALNQLCTQLGAEWFADATGVFHIRTLPAVATPSTPVVWIIDSGDEGVMINRTNANDRQGVYNHVVVISEPFNGIEPARGVAKDDDPESPIRYGGPFGKVTGFYTGQQVDSTANANILAEQLLQQTVSSVKAVTVECVCNPKIQLADVVRVFSTFEQVDAMYFAQSFDIPLDPETPMRMVLFSARERLATGRYRDMAIRIPQGASWQPNR